MSGMSTLLASKETQFNITNLSLQINFTFTVMRHCCHPHVQRIAKYKRNSTKEWVPLTSEKWNLALNIYYRMATRMGAEVYTVASTKIVKHLLYMFILDHDGKCRALTLSAGLRSTSSETSLEGVNAVWIPVLDRKLLTRPVDVRGRQIRTAGLLLYSLGCLWKMTVHYTKNIMLSKWSKLCLYKMSSFEHRIETNLKARKLQNDVYNSHYDWKCVLVMEKFI